MPIDPSIPLGVRMPKIDSPLEMLQGVQQFQQAREQSMAFARQRQEDDAIRQVLQETGGDIETALPRIRQIAPLKATLIEKTYNDTTRVKNDLAVSQLEMRQKIAEYTANQLSGVMEAPDDQRQAVYQHAIAGINATRQAIGLPPAEMDPQYNPDVIEGYVASGLDVKAKLQIARDERMAAFAQAKEERAEQAEVRAQAREERAATPPTGGGSDYGRFLTRFATEKGKTPDTLTVAEELAAKKAYGQADDRPPRVSVSVAGGGGGQGDAKAIAQAIIDGDQPPELTGLYRFAAPVRAELARKGYDLTTASEDWKATQKYLNTLNGAQQTRLRQAITFTHDSLDVIDDLNSKWKGGRFPILNRAQLRLAKNGALGSEAQTIATQLDAQISDLVSELGTVYKGGNSSTDESLKLAAQNLQSDWSQKQLADAVQLARKNLTIRANSMRNVGAVANAGNPYAPKQAAPSGDGKRFQILSVK